MRRDKLICCAVSAATAVIMALTAVAVSAGAGHGDAYIGADTELEDIGYTIDSGNDADAKEPEPTNTTQKTPHTQPVSTSDDDASETYVTEDVGGGETVGAPEETETPPDETTRGADGALGGLKLDAPTESTSFETSIFIATETIETEEDTETETAPPEPETTKAETTPPVTEPPETDPPVTDPTPVEPEQPVSPEADVDANS